MIINQQISMNIMQTVIYFWISSPFEFQHQLRLRVCQFFCYLIDARITSTNTCGQTLPYRIPYKSAQSRCSLKNKIPILVYNLPIHQYF